MGHRKLSVGVAENGEDRMKSNGKRRFLLAGFIIVGSLMGTCESATYSSHVAVLRTDGSYFTDSVADPSNPKPAAKTEFRIYPDFEAVYRSTTGEAEAINRDSFRDQGDLGSGGCLLDGARLDCRFMKDGKAWAVCGVILDNAVALSLRRVEPEKENPANCPEEDRRLFRFVPQR